MCKITYAEVRKYLYNQNLVTVCTKFRIKHFQGESMQYTFHRKRNIGILTIITCILIVLSILTKISTFVFNHGFLFGLIPKFDMDKEANIPTLFAVFLLCSASFLFFILSLLPEVQPGCKDGQQKRYRFLGFVFLYLAFDEGSSLHELLINPLRDKFQLTGVFYFSWVIVGAILVGLLALYFYKFIFSRPAYMKKGFILAAFLYLGGALGVEMIGGYYSSMYGELNLTYAMITTIEESGEFFGMLVLLNTLLKGIQYGSMGDTLSMVIQD